MKVYTAYTIQSNSEILLGLLTAFEFESFEEHDGYMIAYIPEDECDEEIQQEIHKVISRFNIEYETSTIEPQNWNALWESSFEPVVVDEFCVVRADFHNKPDGVIHDIIINPKMAFGTGHHETTYMMMAAMRDLDFTHKAVFDYGCGTGILAILAAKMGSATIDAIDIEEESYQNTIDNAKLNEVTTISAFRSDLEHFPAKSYDIILANINRNVLLQSAPQLFERLQSKGTMLISGILEEDENIVTEAFTTAGFTIQHQFSKGYWKCIQMTK